MRRFVAWISLVFILSTLCASTLALTPAVACSDSYASSPFYAKLTQIDTSSGSQRDLFYKIAKSQVLYHEGNSQDDLSGTGTGNKNWTEYGRFMGTNGPNASWCAMFISWCAAQVGIDRNVIQRGVYAGPMCSTVFSSDDVLNGTYTPKEGDIVTFLWKEHYGTYRYSHVGIVSSVERKADGKGYVLKTIEGNSNNAVAEKNRTVRANGELGYGKVVNFGVPNFGTSSQGCSHAFNSEGICTKCRATDYLVETVSRQAVVKNRSGSNALEMRSAPYGEAGKTRTVNNGNELALIAAAINRYGNRWYQTTAGDWIFSENMEEITNKNVPNLTISGQTLPTTLNVGSNFGIRGVVKTDVGSITKVHGEIIDSSGNIVQFGDAFPNKVSHDLRYSINNNLIFDALPVGSYIYRVTATAVNGDKTQTSTLIETTFTIGDPIQQVPVLSIQGQTVPSVLNVGANFGIRGIVSVSCGNITEIKGEIIGEDGHTIQSGTVAPYSSSHDLRGTINNNLIFNDLPVGSYTYRVTATAVYGTETVTTTLIDSPFTVDTSAPQDQPPVLRIEGQNAPTNLSRGKNFGIRGTIFTNCGSITSVIGEIINSQGDVVQTGAYTPYASSHDLRYSINNDLIFNNLSVGSYIYKVTATAVNGSQSTTTVLIESPFTVG